MALYCAHVQSAPDRLDTFLWCSKARHTTNTWPFCAGKEYDGQPSLPGYARAQWQRARRTMENIEVWRWCQAKHFGKKETRNSLPTYPKHDENDKTEHWKNASSSSFFRPKSTLSLCLYLSLLSLSVPFFIHSSWRPSPTKISNSSACLIASYPPGLSYLIREAAPPLSHNTGV